LNRYKSNIVFFHTHVYIVFGLLAVGNILLFSNIRFEEISYLSSLIFCLFSGWCVFSWYRVTNSYFDLYLLILISTVLFNGGHFFLKIFHPDEPVILVGESPLCGYFHGSIMIQTIVFVFWGIAAMHLGAVWINCRQSKFLLIKPSNRIRQANFWNINRSAIKQTGYILLFISFFPAAFWLVDAVKIAIYGGYKGFLIDDIGYGSTIRILRFFIIPGSLLLLIGSGSDLRARWISTIIIILYTTLFFITGDRSQSMMPLLAYLWIWHLVVRQISKKKLLIVAIFFLGFVMPFVQVVRLLEGYQGMDIHDFSHIFFQIENPFAYIIQTMGNSMGAIAHTIRLVPAIHDFSFGETYLRGGARILPNLFWSKHPGSNLMGGDWFLMHVSPSALLDTRRGPGYSSIAEAYYNFGTIGVPVVMFVWGVFISKLTILAQNRSQLSHLVLAGCFAAFILQTPRGTIASVFRPLIWFSLIPLVMAWFVNNYYLHKRLFSRQN